MDLEPPDPSAPDFQETVELVKAYCSPAQRAIWIARAPMRPPCVTRGPGIANLPTISDLAVLVGVTHSMVSAARGLLRSGDEALIYAVEHGSVALNTAVDKLLHLSPQDRANAIARAQAGNRRADGRLYGGTISARRVTMDTHRVSPEKLNLNLRDRLDITVELLGEHFRPGRDEETRNLWYRTLDRAIRTLRELRRQVAPANGGPHEAAE